MFFGLIWEEEDLPFLNRCQPFAAATDPNSDVRSRILQIFLTLKAKINSKQAYSRILLRVFFFFCTLFKKYSLNQKAFNQMLLQLP
jgi:hypothetical protein